MPSTNRGARIFQFSIRTLLIAMIAVAAFWGGRLSMRDEIQQLNTKVEKLNLEVKTKKNWSTVIAWSPNFNANSKAAFVPLGSAHQLTTGSRFDIIDPQLQFIAPIKPSNNDEVEQGMKENR